MDRRSVLLGAASVFASAGADAGGMTGSFRSGGAEIAVEWFPAPSKTRSPAVLLLHGADGLTFGDRYRMAAGLIAAGGYGVGLVHYLDRTGERRVSYATLRGRYPSWMETVRDAITWAAARPDVDPARIGLVGVSLGAALALSSAAVDPRVRAIVAYSGPCPEDLPGAGRLPATLVLHGEGDRIVPPSNARAIVSALERTGTPHEVQLYPGQGHVFTGAAQFDAASRTADFLGRHLGQG